MALRWERSLERGQMEMQALVAFLKQQIFGQKEKRSA